MEPRANARGRAVSDTGFISALLHSVAKHLYTCQTGNLDAGRYLAESRVARARRRTREGVEALARTFGFCRVGAWNDRRFAEGLSELLADAAQFELLYRLLGDEGSRSTLIDVLTYRLLGPRRVKLPRNRPDYWRNLERIDREFVARKGVAHDTRLGPVHEYDLSAMAYPVRLRAHALHVLNTYVLQQYRYARDGVVIEASEGETIIDGGACWGDTALYFALRAGAGGRVLAVEFVPENLELLEQSVNLNPGLKGRIEVVPRALWHRTGQRLRYASDGPASQLGGEADGGADVATQRIDDLVKERDVTNLGFIKMDVEGAELRALEGAEASIRRWRPKLAISVYHDLRHFWQVAEFIRALDCHYRFYLDHFTVYAAETVLFAVSDSTSAGA